MFTTQSPYLPVYLSFSIWTHPFIYRSVTSESPASPGIFFLFMKETEKLVRPQTGTRESSCRGRLSTGTARRGSLEDMGKGETPLWGEKGKGAEKKDRAKFKITFRQPRTCVSIQMLTTSVCNLLPLAYRPPLLQQKPTKQRRSPPRSFLSSASLPLTQFDYR